MVDIIVGITITIIGIIIIIKVAGYFKIESFTTSKGQFVLKETLEYWANRGVEEGTINKNRSTPTRKTESELDSFLKKAWILRHGLPESEEAINAYNQSLNAFKQGYEKGWKF